MNTFKLELDLKATVSLASHYTEYNTDTQKKEIINPDTFQVQTLLQDETGELVKRTLKVHKKLSEEQLKSLTDKTFQFTNVEEHVFKETYEFNGKKGVKYSYSYSAEDLVEIKSDQEIFDIQKKAVIFVNNVVEKQDYNKNTYVLLQTKIKYENSINIISIRINNVSLTLLKTLLNKNVLVKDLVVKKAAKGTTYITDTKPELIK